MCVCVCVCVSDLGIVHGGGEWSANDIWSGARIGTWCA